jgi:hypothetical protein
MVIEGSSKATKKAYREFEKASQAAISALNRLDKSMRVDRRKAADFYVGVRIYCGLRKPKPVK